MTNPDAETRREEEVLVAAERDFAAALLQRELRRWAATRRGGVAAASIDLAATAHGRPGTAEAAEADYAARVAQGAARRWLTHRRHGEDRAAAQLAAMVAHVEAEEARERFDMEHSEDVTWTMPFVVERPFEAGRIALIASEGHASADLALDFLVASEATARFDLETCGWHSGWMHLVGSAGSTMALGDLERSEAAARRKFEATAIDGGDILHLDALREPTRRATTAHDERDARTILELREGREAIEFGSESASRNCALLGEGSARVAIKASATLQLAEALARIAVTADESSAVHSIGAASFLAAAEATESRNRAMIADAESMDHAHITADHDAALAALIGAAEEARLRFARDAAGLEEDETHARAALEAECSTAASVAFDTAEAGLSLIDLQLDEQSARRPIVHDCDAAFAQIREAAQPALADSVRRSVESLESAERASIAVAATMFLPRIQFELAEASARAEDVVALEAFGRVASIVHPFEASQWAIRAADDVCEHHTDAALDHALLVAAFISVTDRAAGVQLAYVASGCDAIEAAELDFRITLEDMEDAGNAEMRRAAADNVRRIVVNSIASTIEWLETEEEPDGRDLVEDDEESARIANLDHLAARLDLEVIAEASHAAEQADEVAIQRLFLFDGLCSDVWPTLLLEARERDQLRTDGDSERAAILAHLQRLADVRAALEAAESPPRASVEAEWFAFFDDALSNATAAEWRDARLRELARFLVEHIALEETRRAALSKQWRAASDNFHDWHLGELGRYEDMAEEERLRRLPRQLAGADDEDEAAGDDDEGSGGFALAPQQSMLSASVLGRTGVSAYFAPARGYGDAADDDKDGGGADGDDNDDESSTSGAFGAFGGASSSMSFGAPSVSGSIASAMSINVSAAMAANATPVDDVVARRIFGLMLNPPEAVVYDDGTLVIGMKIVAKPPDIGIAVIIKNKHKSRHVYGVSFGMIAKPAQVNLRANARDIGTIPPGETRFVKVKATCKGAIKDGWPVIGLRCTIVGASASEHGDNDSEMPGGGISSDGVASDASPEGPKPVAASDAAPPNTAALPSSAASQPNAVGAAEAKDDDDDGGKGCGPLAVSIPLPVSFNTYILPVAYDDLKAFALQWKNATTEPNRTTETVRAQLTPACGLATLVERASSRTSKLLHMHAIRPAEDTAALSGVLHVAGGGDKAGEGSTIAVMLLIKAATNAEKTLCALKIEARSASVDLERLVAKQCAMLVRGELKLAQLA